MKLLLPLSIVFGVLSFCSGNLTEFLSGKKTDAPPLVVNSSNTASPTPAAVLTEKLDNETLVKRLSEVETRWKQAKAKGDGKTLEEIFADEFVNFDDRGKKYSKAEWIKALSGGDPQLKNWTIADAAIINNTGTTATMSFVIAYTYKNGAVKRQRDTDTFVFRNEKWQVTSSQSTTVKK